MYTCYTIPIKIFHGARGPFRKLDQSLIPLEAVQNEIVAKSTEKNKSGAESEHTGLLLIAAGLLMEGLASIIWTLSRQKH